MITDLKFDKYYKLQLSEIFGDIQYNVRIIGITNITNVENNQENFNVYEVFFAPLKLGLNTYYNLINNKTKIFICNILDSINPMKMSDNKIFIPESLIDMTRSTEYLKVSKMSFLIEPMYHDHMSEEEQSKYSKSMIEDIKNKLRPISDLSSNLDYSILSKHEDYWMKKDEYDDYMNKMMENHRIYNAHIEKEIQFKKNQENRHAAIIHEYKTKIEECEIVKKEYNKKILELQKLIEKYIKLTS